MPNFNISEPLKSSLIAENENNISFFQNDKTPRMVINENYEIIFCNTALESINSNFISDGVIHMEHIFNLNHDLKAGLNRLTLKDNQESLFFHIDWITSKNNMPIMVASIVNEEQSSFEKLDNSDAEPFLDLSFDACCVTNKDGKFITINENFSNLFGYHLHDLEGINFLDLISKDDKKQFKESLTNLNQHGGKTHTTIESYCYNREGVLKWIEWNLKYVDDHLYSTGRDLTPLKSYKDSLQSQQKKLNEAEAIGHIGQWEWKVGTENLKFSDQLFKIFGVDNNDFKPTLDNITDMIDRRDSGRMMQVFQRAIIEQNDYDMDFRLTRPDGDVRYIRCEGRCEIDSDDDVIALYGIMQDVTERTLHEIDLVKAKDCMERAYAAKSQFLANMSHELRTPLNAIIGFSEMIERQLLGPIGTEKYLEYIGGIRESGEHLLDLISDILDMSKIEAGKYELNLEKFNLSKIIKMATHMMEGRALDSNIKIKLDIEENLEIVGDRRAVMQIALNLLSNAVKFSHKDSEILATLTQGKKNVSIKITDHGIGIPANKLANITMPFEQAESDYTREYEGSGLGLAITKELAEIHGGSLNIDSTQNVGTTVTVKLPLEATS